MKRHPDTIASLALSLCVALVVSGCSSAGLEPPLLPAGLIAQWGIPGRVDGAFVKARVVDCIGSDRLVIIDRSGRVQFFAPDGAFAGKFILQNTQAGFPAGMAVAPDGNLWIAETHAYRVGVYTPEGVELLSFGSQGVEDGQFVYVTDVALGPSGEVYACDFGGTDRVQKFDPTGRFLLKWGGSGTEPGLFNRPQALAVAPDGSVFVADACNDRIQKFDADGNCLGVYGSTGDAPGRLRYPYDLAFGPDGLLYIAEYGNCRVQRMTKDGLFLGTWGSIGSRPGQLAQPWALAFNSTGTLFIVDSGNSRVVVLDPAAAEWSPIPKGA